MVTAFTGEFYTHRIEKLIYLHLFTELFHEDFSSIIRYTVYVYDATATHRIQKLHFLHLFTDLFDEDFSLPIKINLDLLQNSVSIKPFSEHFAICYSRMYFIFIICVVVVVVLFVVFL